MNYARFINPVSAARQFSPIRVLTALLARSPPSMISLAAGSPNPNLFPIESAQLKLRDGSVLEINEQRMKAALQYGPTPGQADLLKWLHNMQRTLHNPPTIDRSPAEGGMDMCLTVGSQDAICKSFEMLVSPGDNVILDQPTYSGSLAILRPLGANMLAVDTDHHGMKPGRLREILSPWKPTDALDATSNVPRVLYTIPNGVNPTGASLSMDRKVEIYKIAQDYNLLILEDDPYYFLQYQEREPSFLSLDTDGRVLRFDSFSKILSSGIRLGIATGPQPLIERIGLHMQASVMHTSTLTQVMLVPGCAFMPDDKAPCPYVRASFSLASPQQIETGIQRFAELIREEQKL